MAVSYLYPLLVVIAVGISASQVLMKYAALAYRAGPNLLDPWFLVPLGISFAFSASAQLAWLWALQFIGLAQGYMVLSSTFIFVPIAGALLFHDPLSPRFVLGMTLIVVGVFLTTRA